MKIVNVMKMAIIVFLYCFGLGYGQAQFEDLTDQSGLGEYHEYGWGTAMLDYDRDGQIDILIVGQNGTNRMYRNNGNLNFTEVTSELNIQGHGTAWGVCYGDFDADFDEDIYFSTRDGGRNALYVFDNNVYQERALEFGVHDPGGYGYAACFAPLSKDLSLDLIVINQHWPVRSQSNRLFKGHILYPFTDITRNAGLADSSHLWDGVGCADYDNDGDIDIFISADAPNKLYRNDGNNRFTDVTDSAGFLSPYNPDTTGMAVAWGDFDNDGWMDLYISYWHFQNGELWHNNGNGTFTEITENANIGGEVWANNASWGDFDNDGWLDLYVVTGSYGNRLYMNNHNSTFSEESSGAGVYDGSWCDGFSTGDVDTDGRVDLIVAHYAGPPINKATLYHNVTDNNNNWVVVKVNGYYPNYDAIGARVRIVAGGISQIREVSGGAGFGCQNMLPLHFGLGSAIIIDSLIISFPNLTIPPLTYTNVEPNRYIALPDIDLDVASLLIMAPDSILDCEQQYPISVMVKNLGNVDVNNFKVICRISYDTTTTVSDTTIITFLAVGDSTFADFGPFDFQQCGEDYKITGIAKLLGDYIPNNDTAVASIYSGYSHDIASAQILNPTPDSIVFPIAPRLLIRNLGINSETNFNIFCSISDVDSIVFSDRFHYSDTLQYRGNAIINFSDFTPISRGMYTFSFYHSLLGDLNRDNDFINLNLFLNPTSLDNGGAIPHEFSLMQNYPNPFNSSTKIEYYLPTMENVSLEAFDLLGKRVAILANGKMVAGSHSVIWDCAGLSSGVYFYKLSAGNKSDIKKLILLK